MRVCGARIWTLNIEQSTEKENHKTNGYGGKRIVKPALRSSRESDEEENIMITYHAM